MKGLRSLLLSLSLAGLLSLSACGEVTFFFFWNTGNIDEAVNSGFVLVIGTPREAPPASVSLAAGRIPRGMELMADATVQGIPEETGQFLMTIQIIEQDGSRDRVTYEGEIEP